MYDGWWIWRYVHYDVLIRQNIMIGIFGNPGQTIILAVEVLNSQGSRIDGYAPTMDFVLDPSGSGLSEFPSSMTRLNTGLYNIGISVPTGITAIGTYIASASWAHPETAATQYQLFLINIALPFGASIATPA